MPAPGLRLLRLTLTDFRCYPALTWRPSRSVAVLWGPNGSGKTNLLEAISLLAPGRGLRNARIAELARHGPGAGGGFAVAARLATPSGEIDIGTGTPPDGSPDRRVFRLDGAAPRSQAEIASRIAAVWLTPQMDRLFQEGSGGRRRFLDRLVFALEPSHAREVAAYDTAMASRNRLLAAGRADAAWLAGLEDAMARHGVAVTAARRALVARLDGAAASGATAPFPAAHVALHCPVAELLAGLPALEVEERLRAGLAASRGRDAAAGAALDGPHRADMTLADAASGLRAEQASTGEQKTLLIGLVLGHAALLAEARGFAPLLLLDEPTVHLDAGRRAALFAALVCLPAQSFLTSADRDAFLPLRGRAEAWQVSAATLRPDTDFDVPIA